MELITQRPELKKHLGTVQISNPLSLIQRKAFSLLLYNAYHELDGAGGKMHEIPMKAFCELLGYNSKDFETLDKQIEQLQFTKITWIDNPDEFSRVSFFAFTGRKGGTFQYRFAPELEKKLYHPEIYAQINVLALSQFESRYALALYENLARYRPNKKSGFTAGSPQWSLEEFRELMGVKGIPSYQAFKELNRNVITPAVLEINAVSDLLVTVHKIKKGRSIVALKFDVADNPQQSLALIPEPQTVEKEASHTLAIKMKELYGVPPLKSGEWLIQYGEGRFSQVLDMAAAKIEAGNLKNPIGYITRAFEQGWEPGSSAKEVRAKIQKEKSLKRQAAQKKQAEKQQAEERQIQEEKARRLQAIASHVENLSEQGRGELFSAFYDDSTSAWMFGKFPIARGDDPRQSNNEIVREWFADFVAERI